MPRNPFVDYRRPELKEELKNLSNLLKHLGVSPKELRFISAKRYSQYHLVSTIKRSGGTRVLSVPNDRLKFIQRQIYDLLQPLYSPRWCVQGFIKGRSALENARKHVGRTHLVKIDFSNYFDQIKSPRIKGVLSYFDLEQDVVDAILVFCTLGGRLPQGAPTSPLLANMVTFRFDQVMLEYSKANRLRYTRYADDIALSSFSRPRLLKSSVVGDYSRLRRDDFDDGFLEIFDLEGFEVNEDKLFYCGRKSRRSVTGYTVNEFANVPREHIRNVQAILHDIESRGYALAQRRFSEQSKSIKSLRNSLKGRIGWISATKGISDPVYRRLALRFNSLFAHDQLAVGPDFSKLATMSTWVFEAYDAKTSMIEAQGTAFFLKGFGLVTAAHCLAKGCVYSVFNVEKPAEKYKVTVAKRHDHIDLGILDHSVPAEKFIELAMSTREANVGEEVISWGFPDFSAGKHITRKSGKVSSKPTLSAVEFYSVDFKLYQGTSGGPILNSTQEVLAITHKGGDGEAYDLAVKSRYLNML